MPHPEFSELKPIYKDTSPQRIPHKGRTHDVHNSITDDIDSGKITSTTTDISLITDSIYRRILLVD